MKKIIFIMAGISLLLTGLIGSPIISKGAESTMQLNLQGGSVVIGAPDTITFPTTAVAITSQNVSVTMSGAGEDFFVQDLKGADAGYYTSMQLDHFWITSTGGIIPTANVRVKVDNPASVSTAMEGTDNPRVVIPSSSGQVGDDFVSLDSAVSFIKRDSAANSGVVGKYGVYPEFQVTIPGYQTVGLYSGTLTYTLVEN